MSRKTMTKYFREWKKDRGEYARQSLQFGTEISLDGGMSWESSELDTKDLIDEGWEIVWGSLEDNGDETDFHVWGEKPKGEES